MQLNDFLACITSRGPIVADFGGTAHTSPDAPMGPNSEFSQTVSGTSVVMREPSCRNSSMEAALNSSLRGSMNAVWPGQPVAV